MYWIARRAFINTCFSSNRADFRSLLGLLIVDRDNKVTGQMYAHLHKELHADDCRGYGFASPSFSSALLSIQTRGSMASNQSNDVCPALLFTVETG